MDLLQLRYFRTVAETEHMTRAAQALYISQSSLSKTISQLERELGVALFDRQGRQIRLNPSGKAFLRHVEQMFAALDDGQRELADLVEGRQGQVVLASLNVYLLPDLLHTLLAAHPGINLRLVNAPRQEILDQIDRGQIDLALSSPVERAGIAQASLMREEILLAVPPGHRLAKHGTIRLSEVAHEPFLALKPGYHLRHLTDAFCLQAGITPTIVFEGDSTVALMLLVKAGLGIAFLPALLWQSLPEIAVARVSIEELRCERETALLWSKSRYLSAAVRNCRDYIIAYFTSHDATAQEP